MPRDDTLAHSELWVAIALLGVILVLAVLAAAWPLE